MWHSKLLCGTLENLMMWLVSLYLCSLWEPVVEVVWHMNKDWPQFCSHLDWCRDMVAFEALDWMSMRSCRFFRTLFSHMRMNCLMTALRHLIGTVSSVMIFLDHCHPPSWLPSWLKVTEFFFIKTWIIPGKMKLLLNENQSKSWGQKLLATFMLNYAVCTLQAACGSWSCHK